MRSEEVSEYLACFRAIFARFFFLVMDFFAWLIRHVAFVLYFFAQRRTGTVPLDASGMQPAEDTTGWHGVMCA